MRIQQVMEENDLTYDSRTMFERHKLEKDEGKSYNESNVRYMKTSISDERQSMNRSPIR